MLLIYLIIYITCYFDNYLINNKIIFIYPLIPSTLSSTNRQKRSDCMITLQSKLLRWCNRSKFMFLIAKSNPQYLP